MKNLRSKLQSITLMLAITIVMSSCFASTHVVGSGGTYAGNDMKQYDVKKKHWYLFWGAMPLDETSAHMLAGDAENYTARETFSFGDMLLSVITYGIASPRTIRVSKSADEK